MNSPEHPRPRTSLDAAAREVRHAIQHVDLEEVPTQVELRDAGWHLTHLCGDLAELVAILGEQVSRYGERNVLSEVSGEDPAPTVARAYRELATARKVLEQAEAAAREYYTAISRVYPAVSPDAAGDVP